MLDWKGVYPAVTTQFGEDFSLDLGATSRVLEALIRDGVSGLVVCGTVGEGTALSAEEKREVIALAVRIASGRVPVVAGVAEYTPALAAKLAADAEGLGATGLMVLPPMVYGGNAHEIVFHYTEVATASALPLMLYNNPMAYKVDLTPDIVAELAKIKTVSALKDSSGIPNRLIDVQNRIGDKLALVCGLDDVLLESVALGAVGWVSGMSNVFPKEANALFDFAVKGEMERALSLYRWFIPLLHLDARPDLVQCIKLCEQLAGRGSARVRPPRLPLEGQARQQIVDLFNQANKTRPRL
jgi:1-pyrroline-4-hydroxy-2-carboxylate deaminase